MAYTGTTPEVLITVCEGNQLAPGVQIGPNCGGYQQTVVDRTVFFPVDTGVVIPDVQTLDDLFSAVILLCALVFIIGIIKKAIEQ